MRAGLQTPQSDIEYSDPLYILYLLEERRAHSAHLVPFFLGDNYYKGAFIEYGYLARLGLFAFNTRSRFHLLLKTSA